jgi:hypothetical protein
MREYFMKKTIIWGVFFLTISWKVSAQALKNEWSLLSTQEKNKLALEHALSLKNGCLVVILPTYDKKIAHLQSLIGAPQVSVKKKKRLEKLMVETLADRDTTNVKFMQNFPKGYQFSSLYFLYNKDFVEFINSGDPRWLRDAQGHPLTEAEALCEEIYFGHKHRLRAENTAGGYYFVITNRDLQIIPKPFPAFLPLENTFLTILTFFDGKTYSVNPLTIGNKVQKKLEKLVESSRMQNP